MCDNSAIDVSRGKGLMTAVAGVLILSPDTLLVRLLDLPQWSLQFYRGVGMCLCITLGMAFIYRGRTLAAFRAIGRPGLLTAMCFAIATLLFLNALYLTTVANTLAIISTAPIFGAVLSRIFLKESLPLRTWLAAVGCTLSVAIIVAGDLLHQDAQQLGMAPLLGDAAALAQAVFLAMSFVLVRSRKEVNMAPCMALSGFIVAMIALPLAGGAFAVPVEKLPYLLTLIMIVLPVSFFFLMLAPRWVPAPEVNMIMLLEMVLGPLAVWLIAGEAASMSTLAGGSLLFLILLGHSWLGLRKQKASKAAA